MCTSQNCSVTIPLLNLDIAKLTGLFSHQPEHSHSRSYDKPFLFERAEHGVISHVRAYVQGTSRTLLKEFCGTVLDQKKFCTSADQ